MRRITEYQQEWHFFATSHGKGPCDGIGGTVKRLATKASLQRTLDCQIQTPHQLYEWAQDNIAGVTTIFCPKGDIAEHEKFFEGKIGTIHYRGRYTEITCILLNPWTTPACCEALFEFWGISYSKCCQGLM